MRTNYQAAAMHVAIVTGVVAAATLALRDILHVSNPTTAALVYLLIIVSTAATSTLWISITGAILADLSLNYFFMPPVRTFAIADPENWVALGVFLAVSLIASHLSTLARDREREAVARRDELARLFELSRDVLLATESRDAIKQLPEFVARRFALDFAAICLPREADWEIFHAGVRPLVLDHHQLSTVTATQNGREAADPRRSRGSAVLFVDGREIQLVPFRLGDRMVGLLATSGRSLEAATLDALGGVAAIAVERAEFLDERKAAALAKQSEALKSALLMSIGHDLRTPLTAIRVAATNMQADWLTPADRHEQGEVALAEVERLTRLFQNILDMARIDTGAVPTERRWVHPSEILEAARDQVIHALASHVIDVSTDDALVWVDPRLTAGALAQVLENAARYAPAGSEISVGLRVSEIGLSITVRDHGPGIPPGDLPHVFERFYRSPDTRRVASGTGLGLSIARGLITAEHGNVCAENCLDGGALFSMVIPAEHRSADLAVAVS